VGDSFDCLAHPQPLTFLPVLAFVPYHIPHLIKNLQFDEVSEGYSALSASLAHMVAHCLIEQVQCSFARYGQDHCHHHVHVLTVRDHIVGVLVDRVVVDVHVVVVVVVDVVVDVGHGIQGQQDKGHEVEGVEAKVANTPWTSLPRLTLEELFLTKVLFRVQAHQLPAVGCEDAILVLQLPPPTLQVNFQLIKIQLPMLFCFNLELLHRLVVCHLS